jgi:TRAP-type transport system small permease protein
VAVRRGLHFRLRLVVSRLPSGVRRLADRFATASVIAFGAVLVMGGLAIAPVARPQVTDALEVSMLWFFAALPVGGALMIVFAVPYLWRDPENEGRSGQ